VHGCSILRAIPHRNTGFCAWLPHRWAAPGIVEDVVAYDT
jgi:hypothetical protein